MPKNEMKKIVEYSSFAVMLGISVIFGFMGHAAEMALAIVAGAIAFSFANIERFSKIKGAGFEAEFREKIQAVIEKETEPEPVADGEFQNPVPNSRLVDENTRKVISALLHPEYTWRYLNGIKKETGLSSEDIRASIDWLITNGYARQSLGKSGQIWSLTEDGRYLFAVIAFEDVQPPSKA
ncbi:MAG: hypothetical protein KUF79_00840 [Candidatus Thiodiazotropha sp. (ex Ctena orbiculata)]|nr:hypothetical protein [Candidatus Thiodiazotropha taylori]